MDQQEKSMVELLASNRNVIANEFKTKGATEVTLASLVWTLAERQAAEGQMRSSFDYLKNNTSALSTARSKNMLALVSRMAMSGDDAAYLAEVQRVYDKIMEGKMAGTNARFGTALLIANSTDTPDEADQLLERTSKIFAGMQQAHPALVDDRSMTFATIIALTGRNEDELLADAEECYGLLGKKYAGTGGRKTMAYVLAISPDAPADKVARVEEIRAAFKANKIPIGWTSTQEFAILAMLALDERPANDIAADVAELDKLIKKQKGFGDFSLDRAIRLLYASAIATYTHQDSVKMGAVADNIAIAVAQALVDWFIYIVVVAAII